MSFDNIYVTTKIPCLIKFEVIFGNTSFPLHISKNNIHELKNTEIYF